MRIAFLVQTEQSLLNGVRSDGIYLVRMDRRSGKLERVGSVDAGANPSFLAIHPNGRVLYAVNELEKYKGRATGAVSAWQSKGSEPGCSFGTMLPGM